jgi:hypothetical protein
LIVLVVLTFVSVAQARTITAASCSQADVQTALNAAVAGDTVAIPAGKCTWTTQVSWTAPANVILQGAGNTSLGGDQTVIVDNYASDRPLLSITTNGSGTFRMTGLTFQGGSVGSSVKWNGMIIIGGQSKKLRIDHIHINMQTYSPQNNGAALFFTDWVYGVVDHILLDLHDVGYGIKVEHDKVDGSQVGDGAWAAPTSLGTNTFLFVEDSTFNADSSGGYANDCSQGGRWVWRHNVMNNTAVQTHPTGGGGRARGCRAWEVYQNTFNGSNSDPNFNGAFLSAGTGVLWGNSAPAGYSNFVTLHSMRKDNRTYSQTAAPNGWGYCGTAFNGTGSNWDQNSNASTGYACLDQPGRGVGDLLSGDFPTVINTATGCMASAACAWPRQALEPVYEWLNVWACTNCGGTFWGVYEPTVLVQNQDYYLHASPFTGATGTGTGLLSARPATCTSRVAYWATDTNTLYQCSSSNTWTAYYTPYTYPHPLVSDDPGVATLSPPTNLRVVP